MRENCSGLNEVEMCNIVGEDFSVINQQRLAGFSC
jgi:hypothetical protein